MSWSLKKSWWAPFSHDMYKLSNVKLKLFLITEVKLSKEEGVMEGGRLTGWSRGVTPMLWWLFVPNLDISFEGLQIFTVKSPNNLFKFSCILTAWMSERLSNVLPEAFQRTAITAPARILLVPKPCIIKENMITNDVLGEKLLILRGRKKPVSQFTRYLHLLSFPHPFLPPSLPSRFLSPTPKKQSNLIYWYLNSHCFKLME